MRKRLNLISTVLLLFNGIGALYGGWSLITHPDGSGIELSLHWLEHTPFNNYLIPGIILFIVNGWFSILSFIAIQVRLENYYQFIIAQGLLLTGWIIIQVILIQTVHFFHILLGLIGIILIIIGWMQRNYELK